MDAQEKMLVVWPFCAAETPMALKNLAWMAELGANDFDCLVSYDDYVTQSQWEATMNAASKVFRKVFYLQYAHPVGGQWAPSIAFRAAACHIHRHFIRPWLWMEYDAIPLKRGWVEALWQEYQRGGKAFAGPIVKLPGHMNGTGIYPGDTPNRIPRALARVDTAWDAFMKPEMIHDCHDLTPLYQHFWGLVGGRPHPTEGESPSFLSPATLGWVWPEAVILHRCKDGTLIDRLREAQEIMI